MLTPAKHGGACPEEKTQEELNSHGGKSNSKTGCRRQGDYDVKSGKCHELKTVTIRTLSKISLVCFVK